MTPEVLEHISIHAMRLKKKHVDGKLVVLVCHEHDCYWFPEISILDEKNEAIVTILLSLSLLLKT